MRKSIRWLIIVICCWGTGLGLAILRGEYELLDFMVWLTGVMAYVLLVGALMVWTLIENDEEEEEEDVE